MEKDFKAKVEDREGFVVGYPSIYPSIVDIVLVIKDGKIFLVEVKFHIGENDMAKRQSSTSPCYNELSENFDSSVK